MRRQPSSADVAVLQTASSLVVLAGTTYQSLQSLPVGGGSAAIPLLRDHLAATAVALRRAREQLATATRAADGRVQSAPNPKYAPVVAQALPTVRGPGDVVGLALTLEDVLAQTLVRSSEDVTEGDRRRLLTALGSAAAGRKAFLLILQSLLSTGQGALVVAPPDLNALPAGIGAIGFPDVRFPTDKASPPSEGALR